MRLARPFGVAIYIHATFFLLLAWVALDHLIQGHDLRAAAGGVALILAVFGVVVLHELGHALVARRFGVRTQRITILPFGGAASLERIPEQPRQELLIALAGPAVNIILALLFAGLLWLRGEPLRGGELTLDGGPSLVKLLWINVSLAFFNLLPAFPMDGGRVLRAILALRMEHARATEVAAKIGQGMALLFGLLGLLANPMLILIAIFVWAGARQEADLTRMKSALRGIPVRSAMITDFRTLEPVQPLAQAAALLVTGFQRDFPIVESGRLVGLLTRGDIVKGLIEKGPTVSIGQVMQQKLQTAEPSETLEAALERLGGQGGLPLLVLQDGRILGLLTTEGISDLVLMKTALRELAE